jgi:hypothetical protein
MKIVQSITHSIVLLGAVLCFAGCKAQKTAQPTVFAKEGVVVVKVRGFDTASNSYLPFPNIADQRKWYKDSLVIEEIYRIYQYNDPNDNITWDIKVIRYTFLDLRTWDIYEYGSFSDTAKMIRKCPAGDSGCIRQCWRFWDKYGFMRAYGTLSPLPDTTIDGERFKRVLRKVVDNVPGGKNELLTYAYFCIDKKDKLIAFDYPYSKFMGYPLMKFEEINPSSPHLNAYGEVEYLPRGLTAQELKVFAAWERNAKAYKKKK